MSTLDAPSPAPPTAAQCPLCGTPLDPARPDECPRCDWISGYRQQHDDSQAPGAGRDRAAAIMSLVPGVGHFYKGQMAAGGIAATGAFVVGVFVASTVVATVGASLLLMPAYFAAVAMHAYWAKDLSLAKMVAKKAGTEPAKPVPEAPAPAPGEQQH